MTKRRSRYLLRTPLTLVAVIFALFSIMLAFGTLGLSKYGVREYIKELVNPGRIDEVQLGDEIGDTGVSMQDAISEGNQDQEKAELISGDETADIGADMEDTTNEDNPGASVVDPADNDAEDTADAEDVTEDDAANDENLLGMSQNIGGSGATVITPILQSMI